MGEPMSWVVYAGKSLTNEDSPPISITLDEGAAEALGRCDSEAWSVLICCIETAIGDAEE